MKYIAILDTDEFKDFKFFEDSGGKYLVVKDANAKSNEWLPLHFEAQEMTREEIQSNIEKLSELRAKYNCFDEEEGLFYHALSLGIKGIKALEQAPKISEEIVQEEQNMEYEK